MSVSANKIMSVRSSGGWPVFSVSRSQMTRNLLRKNLMRVCPEHWPQINVLLNQIAKKETTPPSYRLLAKDILLPQPTIEPALWVAQFCQDRFLGGRGNYGFAFTLTRLIERIVAECDPPTIRDFSRVVPVIFGHRDLETRTEGFWIFNSLKPCLSPQQIHQCQEQVLKTDTTASSSEYYFHNEIFYSNPFLRNTWDNFEIFAQACNFGTSRNFAAYLGDHSPKDKNLFSGILEAGFALRKKYDTAVAIVQGGLWLGYLLRQMGLPTVLVDPVERTENVIRWSGGTPEFLRERLSGKKVLLLDKDVVSGRTLDLVSRELIKRFNPSQLGLLVFHPFSGRSRRENVPSVILEVFDASMFQLPEWRTLRKAVRRFKNVVGFGNLKIDEQVLGKNLVREIYSIMGIINQLNVTVPVIAQVARRWLGLLPDFVNGYGQLKVQGQGLIDHEKTQDRLDKVIDLLNLEILAAHQGESKSPKIITFKDFLKARVLAREKIMAQLKSLRRRTFFTGNLPQLFF